MIKLSEQILTCDDLQRTCVSVDEWNCDIYLRELTGFERQKFLDIAKDDTKRAKAGAWLIVVSALDLHGEKIFEEKDIDRLMTKNARVLDKLAQEIIKLNRIGEDVEEATKNSKPSLSAVSSSA